MDITMRQTLHLCMFLLRGPPYGCGLPMGLCLICLAWAALWLRSPYGRVLNMFGMGRPMAAVSPWVCAYRPPGRCEYTEPGSLEQVVSPKSDYLFYSS